MTLRAMGANNATLPVPTGLIQGFIRNGDLPFNKYVQYVPAPDVQFSYWRLDPDESVRLVDPNKYAWAYDDYSPTGKGETMRAEMLESRIRRWSFPYTIGEQTIKSWKKQGIDPRNIYDRNKASQSRLHLANQIVSGLATANFGVNSATPQQLLGASGPVYFNNSSGKELLSDDTPNPNYCLVQNTFQAIKSYIVLGTNGALDGTELIAIMGPSTAKVLAKTGEMREVYKQSQFAERALPGNLRDWYLPESYAGFKLVVDDTVRCYVNQSADGTVADVTVPSQKGFVWDALLPGTIIFASRPGGMDGQYGFQSFSTVQVYTLNGNVRVEARSDNWNELVEARVVAENRVVFPAPTASFKLTGCLDPSVAA